MFSIILIDDHPIVSYGIESLIKKSSYFIIKKNYTSGREGLAGIKLHEPDFAIVDLNLPDIDGEMIIRDIFMNNLKTKIIILSWQKYIPQVSHLLSLGISGYILKDNAPREILVALENACLGKKFLSPSLQEIMKKMGHLEPGSPIKAFEDSLSEREIEVLKLVAQGTDVQDISKKLSISTSTVRVHTKNIIDKMKLEKTSDLARFKDFFFHQK